LDLDIWDGRWSQVRDGRADPVARRPRTCTSSPGSLTRPPGSPWTRAAATGRSRPRRPPDPQVTAADAATGAPQHARSSAEAAGEGDCAP